MSTKYFFNNQEISIPGAYATVKSGIKNPALALAFGNTLIIDTGSGKFFGGGSGVAGTLKTGKDALYTFNNSGDSRSFFKGGIWWLLSQPLFAPGGGAPAGISSLTYIRAKATVPAEITIPFGAPGGGVDDGSVIVQLRDEGYVGNGVLGDEVRATSTVTVTSAGADGDSISIVQSGETLATYVKQSGDTIALVVAGLVASITAVGLSEVVSSNATQLVIRSIRGKAATPNGSAPTISVTGTAGGSATNFLTGAEGTRLTRGMGAKVIAGVLDPAKFIVQFWRGTFKGVDSDISNGVAYDNIPELSTVAELLVESPELNTVTALVAWMNDTAGAGFVFNTFLKLKTSVIAATDQIVTADITPLYIKAIGGTESFSMSNLTAALSAISDLNFDFILADKWGDKARSAENIAIQDYITNTLKIKPHMVVGGGKALSKWNSGATSSNQMAIAFNSQHVILAHGGVNITDVGGNAFKDYDSIYKAADVVGRIAGIEPQNPPTFKSLGIQGELHKLEDKDVKLGLNSGVLMSREDSGSFDIVKGINTLQNNQYLVNPDGTTHSVQLGRIIRQLNKEIVVNAKNTLLKKPNGANRKTVSAEDVKTWLEGYLQSKTVTDQRDDLILSFQSIDVKVVQDAYQITYAVVPNFEVSFLFFTGVIVDPNS